MRLNKAIKNKAEKSRKMEMKESEKIQEDKMEEEMNKSLVDSDEDQMEVMENLMEKRSYNMSD